MATKKIENLLKAVHHRLQSVFEFDLFYAALYDHVRSQVEFPLVMNEGKVIAWAARGYQPEVWLLDAVIQAKTARLLEPVAGHTRREDGPVYWPEGELPQSWLAVPMIAEDRMIGVLVVGNRRNPKAFGENGVRVLTSVARQTAQAIDNARLVDRLNTLYRMGPQLNAKIRSGERSILQLVYKQASELMDTSNLYVALYDAATDMVRFPLMYMDGQPTQVESRRSGSGRTEWIIQRRESIFIETRADSVLWYAKNGGTDYIKEPFASWVGVPMIAGDAVLGVIATYHKTLDYVYTRDDQEILSLLANQAAVALENARLYADLEERTQQLQKRTQELEERTRQVLERNRQLAALQAIGVKMTSQLDLTEVLGSITEQANAIMAASFATLFPYDAAQDQFEAGFRKGHADVEPSIPSNSGFTARIVKTRHPMFVEDALNEPGVKRTFIEGKGVKSFAAVPLIMKDKVLGVLYVNYLTPHAFSSDERETLRLLGNQAAVAIENARLYAEMEQRVVERTQAWQTARDEVAVAERKRLDAEKWAELGKTAGSLAHRIGNKGGIIRVSIGDVKDRLREQGIQDEVLLEKVETIARNNEYLLEMSDLLFKPVQASTAETTRMSLGLLLAEAIKSAEIPQEVQVEVGAGVSLLPDVPANRSFVEVFTEIIINALTAMEASPQKILTIDGRVVNDSVEISFADTGSGIPADKLERLFDLFTQLSDKPIGAGRRGFGLWWVRSFLSSIGGEITGKSDLDTGSVFTIRLPLKR